MKIAFLILGLLSYGLMTAGYFLWSYQSINHDVIVLYGRLLSYGFVLAGWLVVTYTTCKLLADL